MCAGRRSPASSRDGSAKFVCNIGLATSSQYWMSDPIWKLMVNVQISRSDRQREIPQRQRRLRPTTLRSVRELLIDDHYAILMAGDY